MPELSKIVSSSDFDDWFSLNDTIRVVKARRFVELPQKHFPWNVLWFRKKGGL